ncbi:cold-shock protein [Marinobacter confluentis]|uniref:Cold shock domain-containing protein n=1 Tax=Marinobacter confluentis TaxID=1697557 RepID=A0A4Z1C8D7_9GAMM|nr:cold shock domain-containing protein [Marinobacter confluentis]TGN39833.1 cold shock domain-containing protein [Marinobacter confluentis]
MRNPAKAIVLALLVAIPSPFILGFLLVTFTPELFQILSASGTSELANNTTFVLGSGQGIAAYILSVILFALAGFCTVALAAKPPSKMNTGNTGASAKRAPAKAAPRQSKPRQQDFDDQGHDDTGPEGNEEGTVKWFNVKKGFGFIVRDSGDEIFVHFRAIRGQGRRVLRQGQLVRFDVVDADKGLQADNVSILED